MSKSQETWNKKEREKKKEKSRKDKEERKQERKENAKEGKIRLEDIQIGVPKQAPVDPADAIRKGTVTFFNESKGYGFIKDQVTQESVFVHANGLIDQIKENSKVTFEVEMGAKG